MIKESKIKPTVLLVDNGSLRADATLQLRVLAKKLSRRVKINIHPVSLQHADKISEKLLNGQSAQIFQGFMEDYISQGSRKFIILPLFFGESKAITVGIFNSLTKLQQRHHDVFFQVADVICPLPKGEPLLAKIVYDHLVITAKKHNVSYENIVLVDHGSPLPRVIEVRKYVVSLVQEKLPERIVLEQSVMERRVGDEYLFNGELLKEWLINKAKQGEKKAIVNLLFFLAGRHAGKGGDIEQICQQVMVNYPDFNIVISPLIAEHELLLTILLARLESAHQTMQKYLSKQKNG